MPASQWGGFDANDQRVRVIVPGGPSGLWVRVSCWDEGNGVVMVSRDQDVESKGKGIGWAVYRDGVVTRYGEEVCKMVDVTFPGVN